jgi:hypothetical protein
MFYFRKFVVVNDIFNVLTDSQYIITIVWPYVIILFSALITATITQMSKFSNNRLNFHQFYYLIFANICFVTAGILFWVFDTYNGKYFIPASCESALFRLKTLQSIIKPTASQSLNLFFSLEVKIIFPLFFFRQSFVNTFRKNILC